MDSTTAKGDWPLSQSLERNHGFLRLTGLTPVSRYAVLIQLCVRLNSLFEHYFEIQTVLFQCLPSTITEMSPMMRFCVLVVGVTSANLRFLISVSAPEV